MVLLQQSIPQDFFTTGSLATLAGCTGIVYVVSSGIQRAFDYNPKWLALAISIVVSLLAAYLSKGEEGARTATKYIIAVVNGFLIYASATGTNQILGNDKERSGGGGTPAGIRPPLQKKRGFFTRWFT